VEPVDFNPFELWDAPIFRTLGRSPGYLSAYADPEPAYAGKYEYDQQDCDPVHPSACRLCVNTAGEKLSPVPGCYDEMERKEPY